jgi:acyl-CoA thioester hydrolase
MPEVTFTPFNHRLSVQIRFNDVDIFNHVNNSVYHHFYDLAKLSFFEEVLSNQMNWKDLAFVLASLKVDFIEPIYLDSIIEVQSQIASVGNKSLLLEQQIIDTQNNRIKSHCLATLVCVHPKTGVSEVIPQSWREMIESYNQKTKS